MNVQDRTIEIGGIPHYLARAAEPTTAGVLLIPTIAGIDPFAQGFADAFAARGLTTAVWNPYPQVPIGTETAKVRPLAAAIEDEATLASLSRCVDVMTGELGLEAIATVGFCMGGRFVLLLGAHEPRLRAGIAVYPSVRAELADAQTMDTVAAAARIPSPIQVFYPGRDHVTPRPVFEAIQGALQTRNAETAVAIYPEAKHGFFHNPGPENEAAARAARPLLYAFLDGHLKPEATSADHGA